MSDERKTLTTLAETRALYRDLGPQGEALEQLLAQTEARIAAGAATNSTGAARASRPLLKVLGGMTVLAGALSLWWLLGESRPETPTASPPVSAARVPVKERPSEVPPTATASPPPPSLPPTDIVAPPQRRPKRTKAERVAAVTPSVQPSDPIAELALLTRARRVLLSDPARSLTLCEEHARSYPHGTLEEERELLAIEALANSRDAAGVERRAARFARSFPASVHLPRVREIVTGLGKSAPPQPPTEAR